MPFTNEELQTRLDQLDALMYRVEEEHGKSDVEQCLVLAKQVLCDFETFSNIVDAKTCDKLQFVFASFERLYTAIKEAASHAEYVSLTFSAEAEAASLLHLDS